MAPSKCTIAFLLILAAVSASLHPSSAARIQAEEGASPQPPASFWRPWRPRVPLPSFPCIPGLPRPRFLPRCNDSSGGAPLTPLPSFPCIPGLPRPRFLPPCNDSSGGALPLPLPPPAPQPAECGTSLSALTACADFLTAANTTSSLVPPPAACCDGVKALVKDAPVCLCHVMNGDLGKLLPAPMLRLRAMALPRVCGAAVPLGTLRQCIRGPVPPMDAPAPPS
ncbi:hypothetical protein SETIT_2G309900v2 [Setaria italica]|uniref:Bifunctional inhibitor/plant lipid transfer protein/seed storage helical domain-containing protein n=1 Tax=Setaria italica TaxID=4555 RepID=K4A1S7_SETIT|nr:non-specific lipid-transfer protein C6 [Setaria italica]RCV12975.1 hypothetical protein SETIT_2G309900v2 [Setaria italica]